MHALMAIDSDSTHTSRSRLLEAGKTLFAQNGYEQTPTAAIAREAGISESQLMRYYGGKAGLLEAIFDQSWAALNQLMQSRIAAASDAQEALAAVLDTMVERLHRRSRSGLPLRLRGTPRAQRRRRSRSRKGSPTFRS